jgi:hypothetical protein
VVPLGFGEFEQRFPGLDAGVIDEDIEAAELFHDRGEHGFHFGGDADVALDDDGGDAHGADFDSRGFGAFLVRVVVDDDVGAVAGELERDSFANAFASSGDEGDFAVEFLVHTLQFNRRGG